jgi:uncharacterized protein (TIGR03663 family)
VSARQTHPNDEWQLGPLAPEERSPVVLDTAVEVDHSARRLERPLLIVTVEHLGWAMIALWALVTRFAVLGARPLTTGESARALFDFDLVNGTRYASAVGYDSVWAGWVHFLQAAVFAIAGSGDAAARLTFAVCGLVIIATAFILRSYIGRAGSLCLGILITVSPSFTYFSRCNSNEISVAAAAIVTVTLFVALKERPNVGRAIGLGIAGGLTASAGLGGIATAAMLIASLVLLGLIELAAWNHPRLGIKIWFARYSGLAIATIITAAAAWSASELILFHPKAVWSSLAALWNRDGLVMNLAGIAYYLPQLAIYEFALVLGAITGLIAIISLRIRSRFALFCLFWTILSCAYFALSSDHEPGRAVLMLLPAAMLTAFAVDDLHHQRAWAIVRPVLLVLILLTIYLQILTNFIYFAPDAGEPRWARHASLFWRDPITTLQARERLRDIRRQFPPSGGSVYAPDGWSAPIRWYLRDFRPTRAPAMADVVLDPGLAAASAPNDQFESSYMFDLSESWQPDLATLSASRAFRFIFAAQVWGPLQTISTGVTVRPPSNIAPTLILPP